MPYHWPDTKRTLVLLVAQPRTPLQRLPIPKVGGLDAFTSCITPWMIKAFQQAQEYIVNLVYAHLFVHQIAMHLHLHLELTLIVKVTGLSGLFPPSKLPAATGWTRMLHIPYLSHPENFCLIDCGIPRAT